MFMNCLKYIAISTSLVSFLFTVSVTHAQEVSIMQAPEEYDDFMIFLEGAAPINQVRHIDRHYTSGVADVKPWSNSYWPIYKGLLANRYAMPSAPDSGSWFDFHRHYKNHSSESLLTSGKIKEMSPAEKYDLLVGDRNWTLTRYMWGRGQDSVDKWGGVATWTGICHGWAAASEVGIPQAKNEIVVPDVTGSYRITFYPFDIMALVSYLWTHPSVEDHFAGRRCNNPNPDNDNGRVLEPKCFDNNPMTWHLAVVNRMGALKRSLIMDISPGSEVWNFALDSYQITYFNPKTLEFSAKLEDAVVNLSDFLQDPYLSYRSEGTRYLVGVMMDVFYPNAIVPHSRTPSLQYLKSGRFYYDLELNGNMEIIGGEWHSEEHPDFLWAYPKGSNPFEDPNFLLQLDPDPSLPPVDSTLAERAKTESKRGRVDRNIVYKLVGRSLATDNLPE